MGQVLFSYMDNVEGEEGKLQRFKSPQPGVIQEIISLKGAVISKGYRKKYVQ